jgi:hypothetical protein
MGKHCVSLIKGAGGHDVEDYIFIHEMELTGKRKEVHNKNLTYL